MKIEGGMRATFFLFILMDGISFAVVSGSLDFLAGGRKICLILRDQSLSPNEEIDLRRSGSCKIYHVV